MTCAACSVGLYEECVNPTATQWPGWIVPCGASIDVDVTAVKQRESRFLEPDELSNDTSAGRKRAVMAAPILNGMRCEWEGLKFAGGGVIPILGCAGNRLAAVKSTEEAKKLGFDEVGHIHHGPDKSVINNAPGTNLHRVCSRCHNRWHSLNDPFYEKQRPHPSMPYLPTAPYYSHDAQTPFTEAELAISVEWWATKATKRPEYPLKPENVRVHYPMSEDRATVTTATNLFETDMETQHEQDLPLP